MKIPLLFMIVAFHLITVAKDLFILLTLKVHIFSGYGTSSPNNFFFKSNYILIFPGIVSNSILDF